MSKLYDDTSIGITVDKTKATKTSDTGSVAPAEVKRNEYCPNCVSRPGETLAEMLQERGLSVARAAECCGMTERLLTEIIIGVIRIDEQKAMLLEMGNFATAQFWINRQEQYSGRRNKI